MGKLKFRAWDIILRKWYDQEELIIRNGQLFSDFRNLEDYIPEEHYSLMQYTGLKDKNGKEIYEGDILETDLSFPYVVVVFRNGAFMYQCHDSGEDFYDYMAPAAKEAKMDHFLEVVGSIYENPELLEGEKK